MTNSAPTIPRSGWTESRRVSLSTSLLTQSVDDSEEEDGEVEGAEGEKGWGKV